ncbi:cbb3-type cytochrome c oxidase N-terminal domain-containing protein [soil metagenome]
MSVAHAAPAAVESPGTAAEPGEPGLMEHAYDGIHEYDNPLPGWWKASFACSIVFAAMYGFYFHVANWGTSPEKRYAAELADFNDKKTMRDQAEAAHVTEPALARDAQDGKLSEHGAAVFATKCIGCHAAEGRGQIGPNLTDNFQLHGTTRMDVFHTVHDGVSGTAMIAWGEQLPAADILDVVAYVTTLRGTNLDGGKPPQGERVEAFAP